MIHNSDIFAWPEVAVANVGWVPLDPTGGAKSSGAGGGLAAATDAARKDLPKPNAPASNSAQPGPGLQQVAPPGAPSLALPFGITTGALLLVLLWVVGVPVLKALRRRRRRASAGAEAVRGAWLETRDQLRDNGVHTPAGMTVRELAGPARAVVGDNGVDELEKLAYCVDHALWSGGAVPQQSVQDAWQAVDSLRKTLGGRGASARVRAAIDPGSLIGAGR